MQLGQDIRLVALLLVNAAVLSSAIYAARRWTRDPIQRLIDVLLTWYVIQYVAVGIPGVFGILSAVSSSVVAILLAGALAWWARRRLPLPLEDDHRVDRAVLLGGTLFFVGMMGQLVVAQRMLPVFESDAISYHVPMAVQWLQSGRLDLLPMWFFNPANTYSPLAGSVFIYWLMAPMHSDIILRFVQAPAALLLFAAIVQLGRSMGLKAWPALLCALAAASRPVASEIIAPRDDIFLSAFFVATLAACARAPMRDAFGPWRIAAALALALSIKYTALICLPLVLLLWDAPSQADWSRRKWLIAIAATLLLAGPWYIRNLLLTGNPLYPMRIALFGHTILPGLFSARASSRLRDLHEIRQEMIGGYHGIPALLLITLGVGYAAALVLAGRRAWREPLVRACLIGPLLCITLFFAKAPFGEVRFLYPAFFAACVAVGLITTRFEMPPWLGALIVSPLAAASIWTSYTSKSQLLTAVGFGAVVCAIGLALLEFDARRPQWRWAAPYLVTAIALALATWIYVGFNVYADVCHLNEVPVWHMTHPDEAPSWQFVHDNIPAKAIIAHTQTWQLYPLAGDDLDRRLLYVPVRADVPDFTHHPDYGPDPVGGEVIGGSVAAMLDAPANEAIWRQRLAASSAEYLFIKLDGPIKRPPELTWADADARHFTPLFRDRSAAVFKINP